MAEGNWREEHLTCPNCKNPVVFRVTFKRAQHLYGRTWVEIAKSAEIVLCSDCGASVYIATIKTKAEM